MRAPGIPPDEIRTLARQAARCGRWFVYWRGPLSPLEIGFIHTGLHPRILAGKLAFTVK